MRTIHQDDKAAWICIQLTTKNQYLGTKIITKLKKGRPGNPIIRVRDTKNITKH